MAEQRLTRQQATVWCACLSAVSVIGTAWIFQWKYHGSGFLLGVPLCAALFYCASIMGTRANFDEIRRGVGPGLQTLIGPAPYWALGAVALVLLILVVIGWDTSIPRRALIFGCSLFPLTMGIIAGTKWASQYGPRDEEIKIKTRKEDAPPVDIWKP